MKINYRLNEWNKINFSARLMRRLSGEFFFLETQTQKFFLSCFFHRKKDFSTLIIEKGEGGRVIKWKCKTMKNELRLIFSSLSSSSSASRCVYLCFTEWISNMFWWWNHNLFEQRKHTASLSVHAMRKFQFSFSRSFSFSFLFYGRTTWKIEFSRLFHLQQ